MVGDSMQLEACPEGIHMRVIRPMEDVRVLCDTSLDT